MKIKMLEKVKDSHRVIVETEKGPEVQISIVLFQEGQEIQSNDSDFPVKRLEKLISYGFAQEI